LVKMLSECQTAWIWVRRRVINYTLFLDDADISASALVTTLRKV